MPRRKPERRSVLREPPEAGALRLAIAATIAALMKAPDEAERAALIAQRNRLGKQLAHLLKSEQVC